MMEADRATPTPPAPDDIRNHQVAFRQRRGIGRRQPGRRTRLGPGALQCHAEALRFRRGQPHHRHALAAKSLHDDIGDGVVPGLPGRVESQHQVGQRLAKLGIVYRPLQQQRLHLARLAGEGGIAQQPAGSRKLVHCAGCLLGVERVVQVQQQLPRPFLSFVQEAAAQRLHFGGRNAFVSGRRVHSRRLGFAPGQQLADTAAQRARVDGLGDVAVAAGVDGLLLVALHGESRQRHHRDVARASRPS